LLRVAANFRAIGGNEELILSVGIHELAGILNYGRRGLRVGRTQVHLAL
jgi:hypothetical protein